MVIHNRYGDIGSIRRTIYKCPHCGRHEPTRKLYRAHLNDAHPERARLTIGERSGLSNRRRKIKVTLPQPGKDKP